MQPRWRGDGKEIFFLATDGKLVSVVVKADSSFQAGAPAVLFDTRIPTPSFDRYEYDVTTGGDRFLIQSPVAEAASTPIHVLVNWQAMLKR